LNPNQNFSVTAQEKRTLAKMLKNIVIFTLFLSTTFAVFKIFLWKSFFPLIQIVGWQSFLKACATILVAWPLTQFDGSDPIQYFDGSPHITDSPKDPYYQELLRTFPPPEIVLSESASFHEKVLALRKFTSSILPIESAWGQTPEPVRATTLLGLNKKSEPYPNLCSKNSLIFIQYLTAIGIVARQVGFINHTATEVWNPTTQRWEYHDSHFDESPELNGRYLSAAEAHDLYMAHEPFTFPKEIMDVLGTVVIIPRSDFARGHLPRWHYFDFNNLAYFRPQRLSADSWDRWRAYPTF